ncbi:hypothetical protein HGRIS_011899 [Hohenbuehelia grisea]|uniref:Uncharacterized protein n=1 Tax=Hohenbuehelia grisea TaxID=104357 RepID=A0ABR3JWN7_9AGAR
MSTSVSEPISQTGGASESDQELVGALSQDAALLHHQDATSSKASADSQGLTLHEYLTSVFKHQHIRKTSDYIPSSRVAYLVELAVDVGDQVEDLVHLPSLVDCAHDLVGEQVFRDFNLTAEQIVDFKMVLRAHSLNIHTICGERDVAYYYRYIYATHIALVENIMDPKKTVSVHHGVTGDDPRNPPPVSLYFYPSMLSVAVKHPESLGSSTLQRVFSSRHPFPWDTDTSIPGGVFHFIWPGPDDELAPEVQGILEGYHHLVQNRQNFGIVTSYDYHLFLFRDPTLPNRLYVSRLYHSDDPDSSNPRKNALYSSVCFMRVATDPELREQFMKKIRSMEKGLYRAGYSKVPNIYDPSRGQVTSCVDQNNFPAPAAASALS